MSNFQNRLKSKIVWISIVSTILLVFNQFGILNAVQSDSIKNAADAVLTIFVVFGILNNPKTPDKF
jgi:phi LC3 family holin